MSERQQVIARNIANSDTPGFKANELEPPDFGALVDGTGRTRVRRPAVSITADMARLGASRRPSGLVISDPEVSETKPDGNNVTLEDQLLKMGRIQSDFTALTSLYRKQMALMKTALGRGP